MHGIIECYLKNQSVTQQPNVTSNPQAHPVEYSMSTQTTLNVSAKYRTPQLGDIDTIPKVCFQCCGSVSRPSWKISSYGLASGLQRGNPSLQNICSLSPCWIIRALCIRIQTGSGSENSEFIHKYSYWENWFFPIVFLYEVSIMLIVDKIRFFLIFCVGNEIWQ